MAAGADAAVRAAAGAAIRGRAPPAAWAPALAAAAPAGTARATATRTAPTDRELLIPLSIIVSSFISSLLVGSVAARSSPRRRGRPAATAEYYAGGRRPDEAVSPAGLPARRLPSSGLLGVSTV